MEKRVAAHCEPMTSSIFREFSACSSSSTTTVTTKTSSSDDATSNTEDKSRMRYSRLKVELGPAVFEDAAPAEIRGEREMAKKKKLRKGGGQNRSETSNNITFYVSSSHLKEEKSFGWTALSLGTPTSARAAEAAGQRSHHSLNYHPHSARAYKPKSAWDVSCSSEDVPSRSLKQELADFRAQLGVNGDNSAFGYRSRTVSEGGGAHGAEWSSANGHLIFASRATSVAGTDGPSSSANVAVAGAGSLSSGQRFSRTTERAWKPEPFESDVYEDECSSGRAGDKLSQSDPSNQTRRKGKREKASFSFLVRKFKP